MFANRYTVFVDACTLVDTMRRNLLLTLAEAEFFRLRWSEEVLDETQNAIAAIRTAKSQADAMEKATKARHKMQEAFEEAMVADFDDFRPVCAGLPDQKDVHVLAAALKAQASTIVTENLRDFPSKVLGPLNIEARSGDAFIADTIALDPGRAGAAIRVMRERMRNPALTPDTLLMTMDARGLTATVDVLKPLLRLI